MTVKELVEYMEENDYSLDSEMVITIGEQQYPVDDVWQTPSGNRLRIISEDLQGDL